MSLREPAYGYYVGYVLSFGTVNLLYKGLLLLWLPGLSTEMHFVLRLLMSRR